MKRVLLLTTGGTIACLSTEQGLAPGLDAEGILERVPWLRTLCHITGRSILNLDSTDIQPEEWAIIAREVSAQLPRHDGIVILHGTYTMAYTASMLPFLLGPLDKPVILTGSQLPLTAPGTDAVDNLTDAVNVALSPIRGVHIVFDHLIIRGTRAAKVQTVSRHAFDGINAPPVGRVEDGQVLIHPVPPASAVPPCAFEALNPRSPEPDIRFDPDVLLIKMIPGLRPDIFDHIIPGLDMTSEAAVAKLV